MTCGTHTMGPSYDPLLDGPRLDIQRERIRDYMLNQAWRTLREIAQDLEYPEASISAQLRHLRKPRFGGYVVLKRRRHGGTWEYYVTTHEYHCD